MNTSSSVGTPKDPAEPPSLSHAALIAPRTTWAPVSGVQKMTGLSAALNVVLRLSGGPARALVDRGKAQVAVAGPAE